MIGARARRDRARDGELLHIIRRMFFEPSFGVRRSAAEAISPSRGDSVEVHHFGFKGCGLADNVGPA
jgi:hypothetical protein